MDMSISLPLDEGFLRRECPSCIRQFKWFNGATEEHPPDALEPDAYFCPYCGVAAVKDSWWTPSQIEFVQGTAQHEVLRTAERELGGLTSRPDSFLRIEVDVPSSSPPAPLTEPSDMSAVAPPCHGYEPVKVYEDWSDPLFCLVCGERYIL